MPSAAGPDAFAEPLQLANNLPAKMIGETIEEYKTKYGMYVNPVSDRAKLRQIEGKDQVRVYVSGVFDMFHFGHARYLMQAKNMFPNAYLVCGVSGEKTTHELKGQTVYTEAERLECVRHCRYVDEVLCPSPWFQTMEFLKELKIDFTVQNPEPYPCGEVADIYQPLKDAGIFLPTIRTEGVSTSDFLTRIISAYDMYLERNLMRGYSRHDLGINFLTEKRMQMARQVDIVTKKINGLIAGFVQYFYAPISDKIIQAASPATSPNTSDDENDGEGNFSQVAAVDKDSELCVKSGSLAQMNDAKIRALCNLHLGWNESDVQVEPLGKGCTNNVIIARLTGESGEGNDENELGKVLVRLYGSVIPRRLAIDVYINCYLASLGLVPKILGLFEGGRIEEYLPSTCITHNNFRLQHRKIIQMMTQVHTLTMPVPREIFLFAQLRDMAHRVKVNKAKWISEVDWFLDGLKVIGEGMRLGFCHNDVNMNNLLVPNYNPDHLVMIDWEYAGYNYTLFDIANFVCELQYDMSHPVPPHFVFKEQWLPCDADLLDMLRLYKTSSCPPILTPDDMLLKQLKFMVVGSELFWALWAMTLEVNFSINLQDYLVAKRDSYFNKKELYADVIVDLIELSSGYHMALSSNGGCSQDTPNITHVESARQMLSV